MKAPVLPTDKEIEALIQEQMGKRNDVPKSCSNCVKWIKDISYCPVNNKVSPFYMTCTHHKSEVSHIIELTKKNLLEELTECKKIEYLMSVALSLSEMTTTVVQDVETRVKKQRDSRKEKDDKSALKKDLNLCEAMLTAFENIAENLRKIERDYNYYVQPYINRAFTERDGTYDADNSDKFSSDKGEFIEMLLKYHKGCFLNDANAKKVFECLDSLENDQYFPLTEKDMNHYHVEI